VHPTTAASTRTLWPPLETGYVEEFGPVDPEVHDVARDVWTAAEQLAFNVLGDAAAGYPLLKRAVAAVSRMTPDRKLQIRDLRAYLFQAYKRLVLAELEKVNGHRTRDVAAAEILRPLSSEARDIERHILVAELVHRMDPWAREVFENLTLGYSFDEIGQALRSNPHVVRNRFRLALRRLASTIGQKAGKPAANTDQLRKSVAASINRLRMMRARLLSLSR